MGHYLMCRRYGIRATLPFFIPVPTPIGTMGAVILIRSKIQSRAALFDVGIAGPIAGFVVALIVLVFSLGLAKPSPYALDASDLKMGLPLVFGFVHNTLGLLSSNPRIAGAPLGQVLLHPASIAAWVGMYATALNLLPSSQLDGGHIVYALAPRAHRLISWGTVLALLFLGRHQLSWRMWAGVILAMNVLTFRQEQAPEYPSLPANRWMFAVVAAIMLVVTFTISPFQMDF
jgi:membrane-associated protease RseP (regulator of RpoE activity)